MKHAIFQYYLPFNGIGKQGQYYGKDIPDWVLKSKSYFEKYAKIHNADYFFMTGRYVNSKSNFFEVTRLYKDILFDKYDKLLYVDVDVIPKNINANIFDIKVKDVAGWPEWNHPEIDVPINWSANGHIKHRFEHFGSKIVPAKTVNNTLRMINSGVMLWSRAARMKARENFDDHEKWFQYKNALLDPKWSGVAGHSSHCLDQPFLNAMWNKFDFDVVELGIEWNRFPTKKENFECNFAHYVGDYRYQIPELYEAEND